MNNTLTLLLGKAIKKAANLAGKEGSDFTGRLIARLEPDAKYKISKPEKNICVSGTNGKTTTVNILADSVRLMEGKVCSNFHGANLEHGVLGALLDSASLKNTQPKVGVFEVDELSTYRICDFLKPSTFTITNLFQDSFERNANTGYIKKRLSFGIPKDVKLILNASDAISAYIRPDNERVYFDVLPLSFETQCLDSKIQDLIYCPHCGEKVHWTFKRYHHLGHYHCDCGNFSNPEATYFVYDADREKRILYVQDHDQKVTLHALGSSIESMYNQIAAYATLRENGYSYEQISSAMAQIELTKERHQESHHADLHFYSIVTKGYNPIAVTRNLDAIRKNPNRKEIIWIIEDYWEKKTPMRTPGWLFAVNFDYLDETVSHFIILRSRNTYEIKLSCLLDGVPPEKIVVVDRVEDINSILDPSVKDIYLLHDFGPPWTTIAQKFEKTILKGRMERS